MTLDDCTYMNEEPIDDTLDEIRYWEYYCNHPKCKDQRCDYVQFEFCPYLFDHSWYWGPEGNYKVII